MGLRGNKCTACKLKKDEQLFTVWQMRAVCKNNGPDRRKMGISVIWWLEMKKSPSDSLSASGWLTWFWPSSTLVVCLNTWKVSSLVLSSVHRALFDYDGSASDLSSPNQALSFQFGDILHVSSAGEEEWWPARHLSPPPPNCPEVGVIPSRRRLVRVQIVFSISITT